MSSIHSNTHTSAAKRSTTSRDTEDLAAQVAAIRADIQNLTSTLGRVANKQLGRAQDTMMEKNSRGRGCDQAKPTFSRDHRRRLGVPVWCVHPALGGCVYRKPKPGRSGDEVRQGSHVN